MNPRDIDQKPCTKASLIYLFALLVLALFYWVSVNWPDIKRGVVDAFLGR